MQLCSILSDRIAAMEALESRLAALEGNGETAALRQQVATLNATALRQCQMRSAILDLVDDITPATLGTCTGPNCVPSVEAENSDLMLRSPGGEVQIEDGVCGTFNPCHDRMTTNHTLAKMIGALHNLALV